LTTENKYDDDDGFILLGFELMIINLTIYGDAFEYECKMQVQHCSEMLINSVISEQIHYIRDSTSKDWCG